MAKELTKKQELFVAEYLVSLNATSAAIAAGYAAKGAEVTGSKLLRNPKVKREIKRKHLPRLKKLEITAEKVLAEIGKVAFCDARKFFNSDGSVKQPNEIDDDTAAALAGMEVCELFEGAGEQKHAYGLLKKIKVSDKLRALELYGRFFKLFTDKVEHGGENGGPIKVIIERQGYGDTK